jgi:hypothetical protein
MDAQPISAQALTDRVRELTQSESVTQQCHELTQSEARPTGPVRELDQPELETKRCREPHSRGTLLLARARSTATADGQETTLAPLSPLEADPRFAVRPAGPPYNGFGLFARTALGKGRTILTYEGETLSPTAMARRYGTDLATGKPRTPPEYVLALGRGPLGLRYIDASRTPSALARYINHADSKRANVKYTECGTVRTLRRIAPGTQLLANYGRGSLQVLREHQRMAPPPPRDRKRKRANTPPPSGASNDLRQQ